MVRSRRERNPTGRPRRQDASDEMYRSLANPRYWTKIPDIGWKIAGTYLRDISTTSGSGPNSGTTSRSTDTSGACSSISSWHLRKARSRSCRAVLRQEEPKNSSRGWPRYIPPRGVRLLLVRRLQVLLVPPAVRFLLDQEPLQAAHSLRASKAMLASSSASGGLNLLDRERLGFDGAEDQITRACDQNAIVELNAYRA